MIIAIDGPAGSGKSSTAKLVAERLGLLHMDTGAMYRAITLKCLREGIEHTDSNALADLLARTEISFEGAAPRTLTLMDGEDVSEAIRSDEVTKHVSDYCAPAVVRSAMVELQRRIGGSQSAVCEGRDMGTAVFPRADLKVYMVASVEERARRRQRDFAAMGIDKSIEDLCREIQERDRKDSTRAINPLRRADDAIELDTTGMTLEEQVDFIVHRSQRTGV